MSWFWQLRIKVADFWIRQIERIEHESSQFELNAVQQAEIRATHPLLAPRQINGPRDIETDRRFQEQMRQRVSRFIGARQRRSA